MNDIETLVSVTILDKTYPIKCRQAAVSELEQAAHYLNEQLKKLRQK